MPKVSVIVPVYRVENYLCRCIDSILTQSFRDFELILVNDGSPDNCGAICDEYALKDPRVRVIHQQNGGLSAARNAGLDWVFANSDSQWITFIDSDDYVHKDYLRLLYSAVSEDILLSRCTLQEVHSNKKPLPVDVSSPKVQVLDVASAYQASACMKLYHKSCFSDIRFPLGRLHEDAFIMHKIYYPLKKVAFIDLPLYYYMQTDDSITRTNWNPRRIDELNAYEEQLAFYNEKQAEDLYCRALLSYLYVILRQATDVHTASSISNKKPYTKFFKRKMRRALLKNKHRRTDLTIANYPHFYQTAFPTFMTLYWIYQGIVSKFSKK